MRPEGTRSDIGDRTSSGAARKSRRYASTAEAANADSAVADGVINCRTIAAAESVPCHALRCAAYEVDPASGAETLADAFSHEP